MKLSIASSALSAFVGYVYAQGALIKVPTPGAFIPAGSHVTVTVERPDSLTGSVEVAIVLSLQSCVGHAPAGTCHGFDASDDLGVTLYEGPFNPQFTSGHYDDLGPHQNFTVYVPKSVRKSPAVLTLSHWALVGAGPYNLFDVNNITVRIV